MQQIFNLFRSWYSKVSILIQSKLCYCCVIFIGPAVIIIVYLCECHHSKAHDSNWSNIIQLALLVNINPSSKHSRDSIYSLQIKLSASIQRDNLLKMYSNQENNGCLSNWLVKTEVKMPDPQLQRYHWLLIYSKIVDRFHFQLKHIMQFFTKAYAVFTET